MRLWLLLAAVNGLIGVAAGAWGWHGDLDEGGRQMAAMGSDYQLLHALALAAVAWLTTRREIGRLPVTLAGVAFTAGIFLFSGTLYAFAAFGTVPVKGAAPAGGMALMAGWALLLLAALWRRPQPPSP